MPHLRKTLSASTVMDFKVENFAKENLGKIKDLVIDLASGRVAYAALIFGGTFGMGEKMFAIPWGALKPDPERDKIFILDVPKERFVEARGFNKDQWPDVVDPDWKLQT
jgi:sporulation protein YlmC with PRC-barrel domain